MKSVLKDRPEQMLSFFKEMIPFCSVLFPLENKQEVPKAVYIFYLYDGHRKAKTVAHAFGSMQMFQQWHGTKRLKIIVRGVLSVHLYW